MGETLVVQKWNKSLLTNWKGSRFENYFFQTKIAEYVLHII